MDVGGMRTGVAVWDPACAVVLPLEVFEHGPELSLLCRRVRELVSQRAVNVVVVGLPLNMDGTEGGSAALARRVADLLRSELADLRVEIVLQDERRTTVLASDLLARGGIRGRRRKRLLDMSSAVLILESYMERVRRCGGTEEESPPA